MSAGSKGELTTVSEQEVLGICCSLVVMDTEMQIFRFAHLSVREFFEGLEDYASAVVHSCAAKRCLSICLDKKETVEGAPAYNVFNNYAILHWPVHCQLSMLRRKENKLRLLFRSFLLHDTSENASFAKWMCQAKENLESESYEVTGLQAKIRQMFSTPASPVFTACVWGFEEILIDLSSTPELNLSRRNDMTQTALYVACDNGQENAVEILLYRATDTACWPGEYDGALSIASERGYCLIVKRLLSTPSQKQGILRPWANSSVV